MGDIVINGRTVSNPISFTFIYTFGCVVASIFTHKMNENFTKSVPFHSKRLKIICKEVILGGRIRN